MDGKVLRVDGKVLFGIPVSVLSVKYIQYTKIRGYMYILLYTSVGMKMGTKLRCTVLSDNNNELDMYKVI